MMKANLAAALALSMTQPIGAAQPSLSLNEPIGGRRRVGCSSETRRKRKAAKAARKASKKK